MTEAFFTSKDENVFVSTEHTIGPWSSEAQHGGPTAALIGRAVERVNERNDMQVARITYEILKPIPIETLEVQARVVRPGRSVELVEAAVTFDGQEIVTARAWRVRKDQLDLDAVVEEHGIPPGPENGRVVDAFREGKGYLSAMETRFITGSFLKSGPATAWFRMKYPLVDDEPVSPLTRVLIASDSGNGISSSLDFARWLFINPDLSVYLHRMPEGEWVCMEAETIPESHGVGLAVSVLSDQKGRIGRGLQSLFIGPRA